MKIVAVSLVLGSLCGCQHYYDPDALDAYVNTIIVNGQNAEISLSPDTVSIDCTAILEHLEAEDTEDDDCLQLLDEFGLSREFTLDNKNYKELLKALQLNAEEGKKIQELHAKDTGTESFFSGFVSKISSLWPF